MKHLRITGTIVVAMLALMMAFGSASASALPTMLCKTSTNSPICHPEDRYPANTTLKASGEVGFDFTPDQVTCSGSELEAATTAEAGEPLTVTLSKWSFSGCKNGTGSSCTATMTNLPYKGSTVAWTSGTKGTMTMGSGGEGEPRLLLECASGLKCDFLMPTLGVSGGNPGSVTLPNVALEHKVLITCPVGRKLRGTSLAISTPKPVYVARGETSKPGTGFCTVKKSPCPDANLYSQNTAIVAESTNFELTGWGGSTFTCEKAKIEANTSARSGEPLPVQTSGLALENYMLSGCKFGGISCFAYAEKFSAGSITYTGSEVGTWKGGSTLRFECGGGLKCSWKTDNTIGTLESTEHIGPYPARIRYNGSTVENTGTCGGGSTVFLTADYNLSTPKPVYVEPVL